MNYKRDPFADRRGNTVRGDTQISSHVQSIHSGYRKHAPDS